MSLKNSIQTEETTMIQHCYHCGRKMYEDPRGHLGCLNTKCRGYLWGAKRYSKEELKPFRR